MYENIFTYNFIINFILSLIFLITNIIFSLKISNSYIVKKKFFFEEYQPIVIFFLTFCLYVFILNLTILFNHELISEVFSLTFFIQLIFIIDIFFKKKKLIKTKFTLEDKFIFFIFLSLYLISILPLSDADSISIYQYLPTNIFINGLNEINLNQNLEFTLLSNAEILLLISPILKSDNFGSQLNLIVLLFFIMINFKHHKNFALIILSSPLIIYFVSAQKLQLFFGIMYLLSFIIINKGLLKKKSELFIFILLLTFYSSAKISYILFSIPLFIYFFYQNPKEWKNIFLYSAISVLFIYFPLFLLKQNYFGNIFAPFLDNIFGQNLDLYNAFVNSIRNSEGWVSDPGNLSLYFRPFISFELSTLSSSLGLVFLLMIIDYKLQKKIKYLPIFLILLVLATGQILPRYYFEAFLLLAYFYQPKKLLTKLFIYSQASVIFLISLTFIYFAYIKYSVYEDRVRYMSKFSYSFFNSKQYNEENFKGNILDFSLDRHSIFFDNKVYSARNLNILNEFNNKNEQNMKEFIKNNSIKYLILISDDLLPGCLIAEEIGKTYRKTAVRNFLLNPKKNEYKILEIKDNKCNN